MKHTIEEAISDQATVKKLQNNPDAAALAQLLQQKDQNDLNHAAAKAMKGDTGELCRMVQDIAASEEGGALLRRLKKEFGGA